MRTGSLWRGLTLLSLSGILSAPASAQMEDFVHLKAGVDPADIVVTAKPDPKSSEVKAQARNLTRMDDFRREPLAQFQQPVCPGILGLPVEIAELVVDRIRDTAIRIGIPVARENDCRPNILVAFVLDGQAEVRTLAKSRPYLFNGISVAELRELVAEPGPVRAWSSTQLMTRDGMPVGGRADAGQVPIVRVAISDSHIVTATRRDIASSIVVFDLGAINGLSVVQIADYAAMRSFARTRPAANGAPASTILSLFDPDGASPMALTDFDIAYLNSLYGAQANLPASAKLGALPRELRKAKATQPE